MLIFRCLHWSFCNFAWRIFQILRSREGSGVVVKESLVVCSVWAASWALLLTLSVYKVYEVLSSPKKQSNVEVFYGLLLFSLGRLKASCKSHMSTTLLCFKAIFLFELCNEAWTFEVAKMSSEKKVITQFILWLSYFCKQAKTFVKTLRGRSWARNFSSTKCSPKCINSIKGCYTENLLRGLLLRKIGTGSFKTANCNLSKKRRFTITHPRLFFFLWT